MFKSKRGSMKTLHPCCSCQLNGRRMQHKARNKQLLQDRISYIQFTVTREKVRWGSEDLFFKYSVSFLPKGRILVLLLISFLLPKAPSPSFEQLWGSKLSWSWREGRRCCRRCCRIRSRIPFFSCINYVSCMSCHVAMAADPLLHSLLGDIWYHSSDRSDDRRSSLSREATVLMQRQSYPTEHVLSNKINRNRIVIGPRFSGTVFEIWMYSIPSDIIG